jgi:cellulose synthase/poly-beta-1,6-N-acetylglucosamine synthase-like glycosyltransferase
MSHWHGLVWVGGSRSFTTGGVRGSRRLRLQYWTVQVRHTLNNYFLLFLVLTHLITYSSHDHRNCGGNSFGVFGGAGCELLTCPTDSQRNTCRSSLAMLLSIPPISQLILFLFLFLFLVLFLFLFSFRLQWQWHLHDSQ